MKTNTYSHLINDRIFILTLQYTILHNCYCIWELSEKQRFAPTICLLKFTDVQNFQRKYKRDFRIREGSFWQFYKEIDFLHLIIIYSYDDWDRN